MRLNKKESHRHEGSLPVGRDQMDTSWPIGIKSSYIFFNSTSQEKQSRQWHEKEREVFHRLTATYLLKLGVSTPVCSTNRVVRQTDQNILSLCPFTIYNTDPHIRDWDWDHRFIRKNDWLLTVLNSGESLQIMFSFFRLPIELQLHKTGLHVQALNYN